MPSMNQQSNSKAQLLDEKEQNLNSKQMSSKSMECSSNSATVHGPKGIQNVLTILCTIFMIRELIYEFDQFNLLLLFALFRVDNIKMVILLFTVLISRSVLLFFFRSISLLFIFEILCYKLIYSEIRGITAINIGLLTVANFMKILSFIVETRCKKETKTKIESKTEKQTLPVEEVNLSASKSFEIEKEADDFVNSSGQITNPREKNKKSTRSFDFNDQSENIFTGMRYYLRFLISPALVYFDDLPSMNSSILKLTISFVKLAIFFCLFNLFGALYFFPTVHSFDMELSLFSAMNYLKLAYTTFFYWLLLFSLFFKYFPQFLSHLTNFSVVTYSDWWNCTSFKDFWSKWNIQTHLWLKKYIFSPLMKSYNNPHIASFSTFLVSAFVHELLLVFIAKTFTGHTFLAILSQYFVITAENYFPFYFKKRNEEFRWFRNWGNVAFWVVFCFIGQPFAFLAIRDHIEL